MADDRTQEATDAADDILGAGALAARTGRRRGRGGAATVPPVAASPTATAASAAAKPPAVKVRQSASTTTAGGLIHRSIYVSPDEWRAVQLAAMAEGITAAEVVRRAIRAALALGDTT